MKTRLLLGLALLFTFHSAFAGSSLASAGKLELFVDGKRVPVATPQDDKLYQLFGNFVLSSSIIQHLSSGVDREETNAALRARTRLVYTAAQPLTLKNNYGQKLTCKRIIVTIPKNHLPQVVVEGPKKTLDLSGYSLPTLKALVAYPKIHKSDLPAYNQLKPWVPTKGVQDGT